MTDGVFRVEGRAELPDRAFFYVRASYRGTVFARTKAIVRDGAFEAKLGPFDSELWLGGYTVAVHFTPGRQLRDIRAQKFQPIRGELQCRVGAKALEAEEEKLNRAHYAHILTKIREHLRDLLDTFCRAARSLPGFSGTEGRSLWVGWLVEWHLLSPDKAEAGVQFKRWGKPSKFVDKKGELDMEAWRAWVATFQEDVAQTRTDQRRYLAVHVAPKYPRSALDLEVVFDILNTLSRRYSAAVARGKRLAVHRFDEKRDAKTIPTSNQVRGAAIDHLRQLLAAVTKKTRPGG